MGTDSDYDDGVIPPARTTEHFGDIEMLDNMNREYLNSIQHASAPTEENVRNNSIGAVAIPGPAASNVYNVGEALGDVSIFEDASVHVQETAPAQAQGSPIQVQADPVYFGHTMDQWCP